MAENRTFEDCFWTMKMAEYCGTRRSPEASRHATRFSTWIRGEQIAIDRPLPRGKVIAQAYRLEKALMKMNDYRLGKAVPKCL